MQTGKRVLKRQLDMSKRQSQTEGAPLTACGAGGGVGSGHQIETATNDEPDS